MAIILPRPVSEIFPDAPLKSPAESPIWTNWFVKLVRALRALISVNAPEIYQTSPAVPLPQNASVSVEMEQQGHLAISYSALQVQLVAGIAWTANVYMNGVLQTSLGPYTWQDNVAFNWGVYLDPGTYVVTVEMTSSNNPNTQQNYVSMIARRAYI